jgi:hypothetical protein
VGAWAEAVGTMSLVETCMDLLFIFDIFVNFRTAYTDDVTGELVTDSTDVFRVSGKEITEGGASSPLLPLQIMRSYCTDGLLVFFCGLVLPFC